MNQCDITPATVDVQVAWSHRREIMRISLLTLAVFYCLTLSLSACSHIKVAAFDKGQNTVTIQGVKWASDAVIRKLPMSTAKVRRR
jgi:hypothetical protein